MIGPDGFPSTMALAFPVDAPRNAEARLAALLEAALDDALGSAPRRGMVPVPVAVLLPAWASASIHPTILELLPPGWRDVRFVQGQDANSLGLLGHAAAAIAAGRLPGAIVCAVDSLANAACIDHLLLNNLMLGRDTPYGVVPGEAAAVIVLAAGKPAGALGWVQDVRAAEEAAVAPGGLVGRGLQSCLRLLRPELERADPPGRLLTDLSGPRGRAEAFGLAIAAGGPTALTLAGAPEAPALALGDVGEAAGLVLACLALGNAPKPLQNGNVALIVTAGRSAAALISRFHDDGTVLIPVHEVA